MNPERKRQKTQIIVPLYKWAIYKTLLERPGFLENVANKRYMCFPYRTYSEFKNVIDKGVFLSVSLTYLPETSACMLKNLAGVSTNRYRDRFTFVFPSNKNELIERYVHLCGSFPILEKVA